jgi:hypothetical protein
MTGIVAAFKALSLDAQKRLIQPSQLTSMPARTLAGRSLRRRYVR